MTAQRDADRLIKAFYSEGPTELPDQSFDAVRTAIERTRQRGTIGRWSYAAFLPSEPNLVAAAVVLIAIVAGVSLVSRPSTVVAPPPTPSLSPSPSPSPRPEATAAALPLPSPDAELIPGTYELAPGFPASITFDIPSGWTACSASSVEQSVCGPDQSDAPFFPSVSFLVVQDVLVDPCGTTGQDPPLGPTVDDLVAAIAGLDGFQVTEPVDVTLDGHPGKELVVRAPLAPPCRDLGTWATSDRLNGVSPGEANRLRIIDVNGTRIMVAAAYLPTAAAPAMPLDVKAILESVRID
jgi:hypothetical protein